MVRFLVLMIVLSASVNAFAEGEITAAKNRFRLYREVCEQEPVEKLETTPQSPPLNIDDPETPGCNRWEINVLVEADVSLQEKNWSLPLLDINYGLGDNIEFKYEVPYSVATVDGSAVSGVGNSKVGLKYLFFDDDVVEYSMSFYPQYESTTPNTDAVNKGLATPGSLLNLPFLFSKKIGQTNLGEIRFDLNAAYNFSNRSDTANFFSLLVAVGAPLTPKVALMAELETEQASYSLADADREQLIKANVGLIFPLFKKILGYASYGHSLYASDGRDHHYAVAGIRL